ncbi:uroporphyrinogen decarboxylase family protein [Leuconostoc litchii]|uniref:Uroporphyrinogen III decarboxylase n=1 Tax=Leuconostoc litchii TaxID=1981069 RepID=A0A6P2CMF7_9LACO|nr:uroporphyrinogen decarboxylase family protein [Leuconostoc litchii]TYC46107.1 uroporphyrinogen III decarboxylase [Leuconostoc litchii]
MVNTKKEIFTNHYNHVPVSFWYHFSASSGVDLDAFQDPEIIDRTIAGTKKLVDTISPDFVKLMSDGLFHYKFRKKNTSNTRTVYDNLLPITDDNPWLIKTAELIRKQKKVIGERASFYNIFSPTTLLKWALVKNDNGYYDKQKADQKIADAILNDSENVSQALQVITLDVIKQIETAISAGADGIYYSTQVIQDARLGQKDFDEFVAKTDQQVLKAAHELAATNILHICGNGGARNNIHWFKDYPVEIINWSVDEEGISLREGKKLFPNKIVLGGFGNTDKDILYQGTQTEIQQFVKHLVQDTGQDNLIIGANCTVPRDIDNSHLKWAIQAVQEESEKVSFHE